MPISTLTQGISKDRTIEKFVPAYHQDASPFHYIEFDHFIVNHALEQRQNPKNVICKLVLVGDVAVGKSSLVNRFCHNTFNRNYKATIGVDFEVERFLLLGIPVTLQVWDTAGQERFKCIAAAYYRGAHVIIAVFDLTDLQSLKNTELWIQEAVDASSEKPIVFLVGAKRDLLIDDSLYELNEQEAMKFAKRLQAEYWPVSSLTGYQIQEFFQRVACISYLTMINQQLKPKSSIERHKMGIELHTNGIGQSDGKYPQKKADCCA